MVFQTIDTPKKMFDSAIMLSIVIKLIKIDYDRNLEYFVRLRILNMIPRRREWTCRDMLEGYLVDSYDVSTTLTTMQPCSTRPRSHAGDHAKFFLPHT